MDERENPNQESNRGKEQTKEPTYIGKAREID